MSRLGIDQFIAFFRYYQGVAAPAIRRWLNSGS